MQTLREEVSCPSLAPSIESYSHELEQAGFKIVRVEDVTADWTQHTAARVAEMQAHQEDLAPVIGADNYKNLLAFYSTVADLYARGNLGGLRIIAEKPFGW
jgi:hypothetical protein